MGAFAAGLLAGAALGTGVCRWLHARRERRLGLLLAFAAHELNAPLTAVKMTVFNLAAEVFGPVTPAQKPWLDVMSEQLGRLAVIIGEVRDVVGLELTRDFHARLQDAAAGELVEAAARSVRGACASAGVALEVGVEAGLPAVRADPERLQRTLTSLLFHARKFASSGAIGLKARRSARGGVEFVVEYADSRRFPGTRAERLDLYYPARERAGKALSASGLGLGLLREVARRQGGELDLDVAEDGRTRLTLALPAAAV